MSAEEVPDELWILQEKLKGKEAELRRLREEKKALIASLQANERALKIQPVRKALIAKSRDRYEAHRLARRIIQLDEEIGPKTQTEDERFDCIQQMADAGRKLADLIIKGGR